MADEYQLAWVGAETLHDGVVTDLKLAGIAAAVLHGGEVTNLKLASVALAVLHSDQYILNQGKIGKIAAEVLVSTIQGVWPIRVESGDAVYAPSTSPVLSPSFIVSNAAVYVPAIRPPFLFKVIPDRERNPYPAHLPMAQPTVEDLHQFHDEQQRVVREQHNLTQAGDTTFDYGLLLQTYPNQEFTLGSMGRFYHDDFGLLIARFVQFVGMVSTTAQGVPVGRLKNTQNEVDWRVTNDRSKSGADLVMGMTFTANVPEDNTFGWMLTHGANPAQCDVISDAIPAQNDPYSWAATGQLGLGSRGRVVARRWGKAFQSTIEAGQLFVALEGLSPADLVFQMQEANAGLTAQLDTLTGRINSTATIAAQNKSNITALTAQNASLGVRITREAEARIRDVAALRLISAGTDWTSAITASANTVRAEFAVADEAIRLIAVNARTTANAALTALGGFDFGTVNADLLELTGQVGGLLSLLDGFTLDLSTPPTDGQRLTWSDALAAWAPADPTVPGIPDAPSDGDYYARKDGAWAVAPSGGGGGIGGGGASNVFAAVSFSISSGVLTVNNQQNVASVTLISTGRYLVTFTTPYTDSPKNLIPVATAWYESYSNDASVGIAIDRNSDQLSGLGVTAAGASFILSSTSFEAGEVRIVFIDLSVAGSGGGGGGGDGFVTPAPAAAWRIILPLDIASYGDPWAGCGEIEFQDSGGTNLSTGGTAFGSKWLDSNWQPSHAFDGFKTSGDNGWLNNLSEAALQWCAYVTPADITPTQIELWPSWNHPDTFFSKFAVQFSDDGGFFWQTTGVYTTATPVAGTGQVFVL